MLQIRDVTVLPAAWRVLDRELLGFAVRGDAPALWYMSRFVEADGTIVAGFLPGYALRPHPMEFLTADCGVVQFPGRRSLYLIPRTGWNETAHYTIGLISAELTLFSISPMG